MNLTPLNTSNSASANDDFALSERRRIQVGVHRAILEKAKVFYQHRQVTAQAASNDAEAAKVYLDQLRSGWGAPVAKVGPATLYEFGLTMPGYSGPLRGFSASSSETGTIQHVSHVTSKTTSGAGCALLGCLAAGPVGAVAGATMGKKNDVRTDVEVVDNRRFEIQIIGPGVAWSHVGNYQIEHNVRSFRDLLLARSTNTDDPQQLAVVQGQVAVAKAGMREAEKAKAQQADQRLREAQYAFETAWSDYEATRLPVINDLLQRWKRATVGRKIASVMFGPVLLLGWLGAAILGNPNTSPIVAIAVFIGIIHVVFLAFLAFYYRIEYRLLKTLPSESNQVASLIRFMDKLKDRGNRA